MHIHMHAHARKYTHRRALTRMCMRTRTHTHTRRLHAQLSGGERRRVALSLALGFADLVRARGRLSCNVLVLDEVLQQLDGEGCRRAAAVLRELPQVRVFSACPPAL